MMGVFDRIGEAVVNLFSGKKGIILILIIIVSVGVWKFFMTPEAVYWNHLGKSAELGFKAMEFAEKGDAAMAKKDYDKAIEHYTLQTELIKKSRIQVLKAYDGTDDELLKEYAWYSAEYLRFTVLWGETRIKLLNVIKDKDLESSKKYLKEMDAYQKKADEIYEKSKEVERKLEAMEKWK